MKMKEEIQVIFLQVREYQRLTANQKVEGKHEQTLSHIIHEKPTLVHFTLGLLAYKTVS